MGFIRKKPADVNLEPARTFAQRNDHAIRNHGQPTIRTQYNKRQGTRSTSWPNSQLDYAFMERCKEVVCRIPHPNGYMKNRGVEYRVSIMYWSRGAYIDIRQYSSKGSTSRGILLHQDVFAQMLPELIGALREVESHDTRDKDTIQIPEVIRG